MRSSLILFSVCILVAAASASALQPQIPVATPRPRLERRVIKTKRQWHQRSPLGPGLFGDDDPPSEGGGAGGSSVSSSVTSSTATETTSSTTSTTTRSSTTSTSTSTTPTSTSTTPTSTSQSTLFVTSTVSLPSSSTTAEAAATSSASEDSGSGGHTGLIVGVSVVGGLALLGGLIFLWMKFGGRRFSDYDREDADIKWPELKADENAAAMQPLPARRTGGAGFDMGDDSDNGHDDGFNTGAGDNHSLRDYGAKAHDSMVGSSTALHSSASAMGAGAGGAYAGGYGGHQGAMETVYDDEQGYLPPNAHSGVTGYYDSYGSYGHGEQPQQVFYPQEAGSGGASHEYGSYGMNTSPPSGPYHVTGRGGY